MDNLIRSSYFELIQCTGLLNTGCCDCFGFPDKSQSTEYDYLTVRAKAIKTNLWEEAL